jgi:hypothetical protein
MTIAKQIERRTTEIQNRFEEIPVALFLTRALRNEFENAILCPSER